MYNTIIDPDTLYAHLEDPLWVVVDCRFRLDDPGAGRAAFEMSHVPGAVYAHVDDHLAAPPAKDIGRHPLPDLDAFMDNLGAWGISNESQVVVYDDAGAVYAARLWWMLRFLGHSAVAVLDGGWQAWAESGYPTEVGRRTRAKADFVGVPNWAMAATLEEVEQIVAAGQGGRLVDSRDPRRYRGEFEPIDPKAGHIPGAKNRFINDNVGGDQRFRPADQLRDAFEEVLDGRAPDDAIVYCGSGVTAAQNLLAMQIAGLEGARLFVHSWSGWSSDSARPIATGDEPGTDTIAE